ncbi:histidine kinase [Streptomyces sp. NPDC006798]|uniref:sensor histidine kinase n=1 Tax=Streptomyces sp. NPDC006798 TaxID=3155462 RepID=UPI0034084B1D
MTGADGPWNALVVAPAVGCVSTIGWAAARPAAARLRADRGSGGTGGEGRGLAAVRSGIAPATAGCALLSLAATFAVPAASGEEARSAWSLAEAGLLLVLIAAVVRLAPRRRAGYAVPLAALAVCLWPVPSLTDGSWAEVVAVMVFWLLPVGGALAVGGYPRRAAARRRAAVDTARREQRLRLSRDLHDFVAHDISGIVVQAQAARFVAESDPGAALLALERIERAGLNALASMDRTVAMLRDRSADGTGGSADTPPPGPELLPRLVADFGTAGAGGSGASGGSGRPGAMEAVLDADEDALAALDREAGAAAYRIVVEALTNVRRHAPDATRVTVRVHRAPAGVAVSVTDDGTGGGPTRFRLPRRSRDAGGLGLPALTEHVTALGGTLTAGRAPGTAAGGPGAGWCLTAVFPADADADADADAVVVVVAEDSAPAAGSPPAGLPAPYAQP